MDRASATRVRSLLVLLLLAAAGCAARIPPRVAYRDGHRSRLAQRAEGDLGCSHATLTPLGPRVVQAVGCGQMREYAWTGRAWVAVTTVPALAPVEMRCPLDLLEIESEGPLIRIAEGCGIRARYDLECDSEGCAWSRTARSGARAGGSDGPELWPSAPDALLLAIEEPRLRRGRDAGLIGVGLGLSLGGMLGAVALGVHDFVDPQCSQGRGTAMVQVPCDVGWLAAVPVIGGVLARRVSLSGSRDTHAAGLILGIVAGAAQLAGLVVLVIGAHGVTDEVVPGIELGGAELSILPEAGPDGAGLTIGVRL